MRVRGWSAYLTTPAGWLAPLFVQDPRDRSQGGDIIAARDTITGHWWYWFSWAERIAPAAAAGRRYSGGMFWLRWRTLSGSYRRFSACRRSNASSPNAARTRSIGSSACM